MLSEGNDIPPILLFKYGGNAMTSEPLQRSVLQNICTLKDKGYAVVIVHGGGPFIQQILNEVKLDSEFVEGHRKTTEKSIKYVEMALKGRVNGQVVSLINSLGYKAVGLSGRDGKTVTAEKRYHEIHENGQTKQVDLGLVGKVKEIDPSLIYLLLQNDFIPVITCIAPDENNVTYNINADLFAGSLAGALKARAFVALTDVDGLLRDINDKNSLINELHLDQVKSLTEQGIIAGGMIPKVEACTTAVEGGAGQAVILNGRKPEQILSISDNDYTMGTRIIQ